MKSSHRNTKIVVYQRIVILCIICVSFPILVISSSSNLVDEDISKLTSSSLQDIENNEIRTGRNIYEFHGCYWHGCPKCMKNRQTLTADNDLKADEAYEQTMKRTYELRNAGYTVIEMWECELLHRLHSNPEMKRFFDTVEIVEPINPREEIHFEACSERKLGHTLTKFIAACPGAWHGHVETAGHLCSRHYKVCSWKDATLLQEMKWSVASAITGCYAFNAAQDGGQCTQCKNDVTSDDLAAIGKHCPHVNFGQKACLNEGRIDASCCVDSLTRRACSYVPGVVTGVLCCYDPDSEKNQLLSDGGPAQLQLNSLVGQRIALHCPIAPGTKLETTKIAWYKDGTELAAAAAQASWTIPFSLIEDSGIYSCRTFNDKFLDVEKTEQLIQINVTVNEVKSNACQDGTTEGFHHEPHVRGCAGSWKGHIRRADKQLCGPGWRVCVPKDRHVLKLINRTYLSDYGGCFAYNAAHIKSKCKRCQNKHSMAALGRDCPINEPFVTSSNTGGRITNGGHHHRHHPKSRVKHRRTKLSSAPSTGRVDHHACFDDRIIQIYSNKYLKQNGHTGGCMYDKNGRITGVLCCKRQNPNNGHPLMDPPVDDETAQKEEILNCYPECRNGGTCIHGKCVCLQGFFGHACQHGGCTPECQNGGLCLYGFCKCNPPYYGLACQEINSGKNENVTEEIFDNQLDDSSSLQQADNL